MQFGPPGFVPPPPRPPKTNAERQREFRKRNPDYYRLLQAKRRAECKARYEAMVLEERRAREAARATVVRREPLMLPAPVERIELPDMDTMITVADLEALRERLMVRVEATPAPKQAQALRRPLPE